MPIWSSSNPNSGDPYGPPNDDDEDSSFNAMLAAYKPLLQKLTLSSFMGYCSAITAKRVGKSLAFVAGLGFITLQCLVHKGFVDVDWKKVEKSVVDVIDTVSVSICMYIIYVYISTPHITHLYIHMIQYVCKHCLFWDLGVTLYLLILITHAYLLLSHILNPSKNYSHI